MLPRRCCVCVCVSVDAEINAAQTGRPGTACASLPHCHCHSLCLCLCLCLCLVGLLRGNWGKSIKISQESPSRRNVANIKSDKQTNKHTDRQTHSKCKAATGGGGGGGAAAGRTVQAKSIFSQTWPGRASVAGAELQVEAQAAAAAAVSEPQGTKRAHFRSSI